MTKDSSAARWETFAHGSDVGVRGTGSSPAEAFEQVALALTSIVAEVSLVEPRGAVVVERSARDLELLLLDWVDALIYEMATRRMIFSRFEVEIAQNASAFARVETSLRARAFGEPIDVARHQPAIEVKGATAAELCVVQDEQGVWRAQCVVDV